MASTTCWWIGETLPREFAVSLRRLVPRYRVLVSPRLHVAHQLLDVLAGPGNAREGKGTRPEPVTTEPVETEGAETEPAEAVPAAMKALPGQTVTAWPELASPTTSDARRPLVISWSEQLNDAARRMASWFPPQLIVWAQRYPSEIPPSLVERTKGIWPAARQLVLAGSWSDAEGRTGQPLVGLERQPAVTWMNLPGWEALVAEPTADPRRCAVLLSADAGWAEMMSGGLGAAGWVAVWGRRLGELMVERPSVVLIDLARQESDRLGQIAEARRHFRSTPLVGMLAFPRPLEVAQLKARGLAAILPQPVNLDMLLEVLERESMGAGERLGPERKRPDATPAAG